MHVFVNYVQLYNAGETFKSLSYLYWLGETTVGAIRLVEQYTVLKEEYFKVKFEALLCIVCRYAIYASVQYRMTYKVHNEKLRA